MRGIHMWREWVDARPEWWVVVIGLASWGWIAREGLVQSDHAMHHAASGGSGFVAWQAMVLAMMLPTLAMKAREVALRCFEERRHYSMAVFLAGYLAPWSVFGAAALALRQLPWTQAPYTVVGLCAVATAWAIVPLRERAMMTVYTYAPVIAPDGWDATRDCATAGVAVGASCIVSCWPLMLACAASGHDVRVVAVGGAIAFVESRSFRPPTRLVLAASAALTVAVAFRA
jgi:predicted metal-binding membrane protein